MATAKSDVNGPKKKYVFGNFELESDINIKKIDPLYIGLVKGFNFLFEEIRLD